MERSGLTFMTHCWQFLWTTRGVLVSFKFISSTSVGKTWEKSSTRFRKKLRTREKFERISKPSSKKKISLFQSLSISILDLGDLHDLKDLGSGEEVGKNFFYLHIFWTPGILWYLCNSLFKFLPGINRQSEEECEWSNSLENY